MISAYCFTCRESSLTDIAPNSCGNEACDKEIMAIMNLLNEKDKILKKTQVELSELRTHMANTVIERTVEIKFDELRWLLAEHDHNNEMAEMNKPIVNGCIRLDSDRCCNDK